MSESQPENKPKKKFSDPMDDFLDRPIAFNPAFKRITGSTVAALMLSQAWYWSKRTTNGWFYKSGKEWEEETGLSRSEQETARKILVRIGLVNEDLRGVPATMYYRVNKKNVYELLGIQFATSPQTEIAETQQTEFVEIPQTSLPESSKQDCDILPNINKESENTLRLPEILGAEAPANINPNSGRRTDAKVLGDPMAGILYFAKQAEDVNAELENRVNDYPSDCHRTLRLLVEIFGWLPASIPAKPARGGKGGAYAQWINEIREIDQGVGSFGQDGIRFVANACKDLTVSHPGAITWAIAGEIGKYARKQAFVAMSAPKPIDTPYTRAIENPSVISPENEAKLAAFRKRLRAQS